MREKSSSVMTATTILDEDSAYFDERPDARELNHMIWPGSGGINMI